MDLIALNILPVLLNVTLDCWLQNKMGASKDFEMSPFEAARKLLSMEATHLNLGQQSDLIFQDMDLVPLLIQENYLNHRPVVSQSDAQRMQVYLTVYIKHGLYAWFQATWAVFVLLHHQLGPTVQVLAIAILF